MVQGSNPCWRTRIKVISMKVICKNCSKEFDKKDIEIKRSPNHHCSRKCVTDSRRKTTNRYVNLVCANCNKTFERFYKNIRDINKSFCSISCSNKHSPKRRRKQYYCLKCNDKTSYRKKYCKTCYEYTYKKEIQHVNSTLLDLKKYHKNIHQYNAKIRQWARSSLERVNPNKTCSNCSFSHFAECCHIKPIKDFPDTALVISEVNHIDNLIWLCPNCHWLLDNGILELE